MDFGKRVKARLIEMDKNQLWLIEEVRKVYPCYLESAYMSKILSGKRKAPKIRKHICEILNIEE